MSVADPALAARVEAWIDSAGHSADEVVRTTRAVLDAGFDPAGVRIVVDAVAHEDTSEMIRGAESVGIETLSADTATLDERLSPDDGRVPRHRAMGRSSSPTSLPKAIGFLDGSRRSRSRTAIG